MDNNKFIKDAQRIADVSNLNESIKDMANFLQPIAKAHRDMFEAMKEQGYDDNQAFAFASTYMLKSMFPTKE